MKYRHFSDEKGSNFEKLSEDIKRAIETQANIDLQAHKLCKYYGHVLKDDETEEGLFKMICKEYAAKSEEELRKLVIVESRILYFYPLTKDRMEYYMTKAKERAETMDRDIDSQTRSNYKFNKDTGR